MPESEQSRVRGLLQGIENELETVNTQIARAQEYVLFLQAKQAGYIEDMAKLRPAIAPHKSLPSEMLVEIFLQYAAEIAEKVIRNPGFYGYYGLAPFPWVLGQICSRWRRIALAEPRIWSIIGLSAADQDDLPMLNEAFRRGGKSPLWLSARDTAPAFPDSFEPDCARGVHYDDFLRDVVCSQSKRITRLCLLILDETFDHFLSLPSDSFPVLETTQLEVVGGGDSQNNEFPRIHNSDVSVFRGAARLRWIDIDISAPWLDVATPAYFPMNLGLCWPQLTHFNFLDISIQVSVAHELMKLCTSLHDCFLRLMTDVSLKVAFPVASIHLPHLQYLVVNEAGPYSIVLAKFVRPLVLPALQDFHFSLSSRTLPTDIAFLADIIKGWSTSRGPALRSELNYDGPHLEEITEHLPFLTSINAYQSVLLASMIRMMTQEQYLPNLASLSAGVACADMEAFIDMPKTRWARSVVRRQQQPGASVYVIRFGNIRVLGADDESISSLSSKILQVQEEVGVSGIKIYLQTSVFPRNT